MSSIVKKILDNKLFEAKKELWERTNTVASMVIEESKKDLAESFFDEAKKGKDKIKVDGEDVDNDDLDEALLDECFQELSEEFDLSDISEEQLDELSKELLGRYVKKAKDSLHRETDKSTFTRTTGKGAKTEQEKQNIKNRLRKHNTNVRNRSKGISKAVDKLVK